MIEESQQAVLVSATWRAKCKKCGATSEYSVDGWMPSGIPDPTDWKCGNEWPPDTVCGEPLTEIRRVK